MNYLQSACESSLGKLHITPLHVFAFPPSIFEEVPLVNQNDVNSSQDPSGVLFILLNDGIVKQNTFWIRHLSLNS